VIVYPRIKILTSHAWPALANSEPTCDVQHRSVASYTTWTNWRPTDKVISSLVQRCL